MKRYLKLIIATVGASLFLLGVLGVLGALLWADMREAERAVVLPIIEQRFGGVRNRYCYSAIPEHGWFRFTGVAKHDHDTGRSWSLDLGPQRYGSEPAFAPRVGATDEDDGYLVSFVTDMNENRSECLVLNAADIEAGPVCRFVLPHRISSGTHATWAHGEDIRAAAAQRVA